MAGETMGIKLSYITRERKERLLSWEEIRSFGQRCGWPDVTDTADYFIRHPEAKLSGSERLMIERALEIHQSELALGESGEYFEVELT